ncbi:MAG: TonB-dependent siderophore receptor [Rhizobacter sp.]
MSRKSAKSRRAHPGGDLPATATASVRTLMPLGALAAGFGLLNTAAMAQTAPAAPSPAASAASVPAAAPSASSETGVTTLAPVPVKAKVESDATSVRATTSTIGKGNQEIRDIPQSVTVMTEKLLDDRKLTTLKEALHHVAGISFAATENGTDQDIRIRGFPIATVGDLFIDSMRDPSQYERDTFNFERVEVLRGSASMLFGRGSTGGVVNQVTKKPELADLNQLDLTAGTGEYVRSAADFNVRTGETSAFRVNAMNNTAKNGGAKIDKHGIAPTYSYGIGTPDQFTAGLFYLKVNNVPRPGIGWLAGQVPDLDPGKFYGLSSDKLQGEATYGTLSHVHRFDDGAMLQTKFRTGNYKRLLWSSTNRFGAGTTPANLNDSTTLTRGQLTPRRDSYETTYLQSDYSGSFVLAGLKNEILAGVDVARESANRYGAVPTTFPTTRPGTTVGTPNDGASAGELGQWRDTQDYASTSGGAFVQDTLHLTKAWKLMGGVRFDSFDGKFSQTSYTPNNTVVATANRVETSMSEALFSYRTGVLYQPTEAMSFHMSYSTSFNTSADTYQFTTALNANTPPEKSRNFEIGAKLDWLDGKLSTRGAFFKTEKYNERNTDLDTAGTAYLLSGARYAQGFEFDVVGKPAPEWEVYLSLSYVPKAEITQAASTSQGNLGKRVGLTPKRSGSVWVSYQATPSIRAAAGANGASKTYPLTVAGNNSAAGWYVADAMMEYKFTPDILGQVTVTNMFNRTYGDQLYPGFVVLGEPRKVMFTLAAQF